MIKKELIYNYLLIVLYILVKNNGSLKINV